MAAEIVATVLDPDGRSVDLTGERWAHITDGHPELARYRNEVLETSGCLRGAGRAAQWARSGSTGRASGRVGG